MSTPKMLCGCRLSLFRQPHQKINYKNKETMRLYEFQKTAIVDLLNGSNIVVSSTGSGKGAMAVIWAKKTCEIKDKKRVLVVTTASKSRTGDFEADADAWCGEDFRKNLKEFTVISWHKLRAWYDLYHNYVARYVIIFDEIAKASAGVSSGMGRAFLKMTKVNNTWAGFTATPGDNWLKFYPYFQACGWVRNKTEFMNKHVVMQTYRGFPEIIGYRDEDKLKSWWKIISTAPDTSQMMAEMPPETHKVIYFNKTKDYDRTWETLIAPDGTELDTSGALCAELRRLCFTKDKQQWIKDFVDNLECGAVMFYNFIATGNMLEELVTKVLPKGSRVWRIDGKHHEIPTAKTIGKKDIVLCQWQSGSEALNLQFLHYWVSVELCYSYSTAIQARGRIKRIGQQMPMHYYYLQTTGTIEEAIMDCLKNKGEFAEDVWLASLKERGKE